jgi:hypothetical protein
MKKIYCICMLTIIVNIPVLAFAGGFETLYDKHMLREWKSNIEYSLPYNLNEYLIGNLRSDEREMVERVQFVFNETEKWGEPFCYFVRYSSKPNGSISRIHFSLTTLRFWRDICLSYAWLESNGYSIETIGAYMSMMKYRMMVDGYNTNKQYTPPLKALQIPHNAFDYPRVVDLYDKLFNSSILFVIAHEIGHVRYRHKSNTFEESRRNEEQADKFALELMRRINMPPMGMVYLFTTLAHFVKNQSDFYDKGQYKEYLMSQTHPLEGNRVIGLGEGIKQRSKDFARIQNNPGQYLRVFKSLGEQIIEVGNNLNTPSMQLAMTLQGASTGLKSLTPRRPGQASVNAYGVPQHNSDYTFNGIFSGNITDKSGSASVDLVLKQNGKSIIGVFTQGIGTAYINGRVKGDILEFNWEWGNSKGKGFFKSNNKGKNLTGQWGINRSKTGRGKWIVRRK